MRISDWSSDVCSSDLTEAFTLRPYASLAYTFQGDAGTTRTVGYLGDPDGNTFALKGVDPKGYATVAAGLSTSVADKVNRSEEHTSELQSLMRISYPVFCLK